MSDLSRPYFSSARSPGRLYVAVALFALGGLGLWLSWHELHDPWEVRCRAEFDSALAIFGIFGGIGALARYDWEWLYAGWFIWSIYILLR